MAEQKPRSLAERLYDALSEEDLSRPVRLEGVDQVFTIGSLLRPADRRIPRTPPVETELGQFQRKRSQGGTR